MRARAKLNKKMLLDCVDHWTYTEPTNILKDDQYLFPDGTAHELTDNFPRHHSITRCYVGQYELKYGSKWYDSKHVSDIDLNDTDVVADFLDRTGAIRVARSDTKGNGENAFQVSATNPPTDKQTAVLRKHCRNTYSPCTFDFSYFSDAENRSFSMDSGVNLYLPRSDKNESLDDTLCRHYNRIYSGKHGVTPIDRYAGEPEIKALKKWLTKKCRA